MQEGAVLGIEEAVVVGASHDGISQAAGLCIAVSLEPFCSVAETATHTLSLYLQFVQLGTRKKWLYLKESSIFLGFLSFDIIGLAYGPQDGLHAGLLNLTRHHVLIQDVVCLGEIKDQV